MFAAWELSFYSLSNSSMNINLNVSFCVPQKKEYPTGLWHETSVSYDSYSFKYDPSVFHSSSVSSQIHQQEMKNPAFFQYFRTTW